MNSWLPGEAFTVYYDVVLMNLIGKRDCIHLLNPINCDVIKNLIEFEAPLALNDKPIIAITVNDSVHMEMESGAHWWILVYHKEQKNRFPTITVKINIIGTMD